MPPKAAWKTFQANPELEFEFFLAAELGMTVGELRQRMSQDEFIQWSVYYGRKSQDMQAT
jgi:hypothetical protein